MHTGEFFWISTTSRYFLHTPYCILAKSVCTANIVCSFEYSHWDSGTVHKTRHWNYQSTLRNGKRLVCYQITKHWDLRSIIFGVMSRLLHTLPRHKPNRIFPASENMSETDDLLLCAVRVKGQLQTMSRPDSSDIVWRTAWYTYVWGVWLIDNCLSLSQPALEVPALLSKPSQEFHHNLSQLS